MQIHENVLFNKELIDKQLYWLPSSAAMSFPGDAVACSSISPGKVNNETKMHSQMHD